MSDRFKFRVWDKESKAYAVVPYGNFVLFDDGKLFWIESRCEWSELNTDCFVVEQCMGLKDKNGRLVFEGDIVFLNGEKWLVIWNGEDCAFFFSSLKEVYHQPIFHCLR